MKQILAIHKNGVTMVDQKVLQDNCKHPEEYREQMITGGLWITNGEVYDTQQLHVVCTLCGKIIWSEKTKKLTEIPY
jgi:hypothetical protein